MTRKRLLSALALILLVCAADTRAQQTPAAQPSEAETTRAKEEEARKEIEKKALAMLEEVVGEARSLKVAENRVRVLAAAADLFWPRDEKRARALFREVVGQIVEVASKPERNAERRQRAFWEAYAMRQEFLQTVARRDPQLALELLQASRQQPVLPPGADAARYKQFDPELMLEQRLVAQVAATDPKRAARMAEETLSKGISFELMNFVQQLYARDPTVGAEFAGKVAQRLKSENLLENQIALSVADVLLDINGRPQNLILSDPSGVNRIDADAIAKNPLLDAQTSRELLESVVAAALAGDARSFPMSMQSLLPEVEKLWPERAALLRQKQAEYVKTLDPESRKWVEYSHLLNRATPEALIEAAASVPQEMRSTFYSRAAYLALSKGDTERARQIVNEHVRDSSERAQILSSLEQYALWSLLERGKFEEARKLVSEIRRKEDRIAALSQLALMAALKGERKLASQLLEEARALVGERIKNPQQLNQHLQLARAYALVEPPRAFEIVEAVVDRANDMIAAADVLDGFLGGPEIFQDGELVMGHRSGVPGLDSIFAQYGQQLAALARADFERTRSAAARFQRPEVRTMARLLIAQGLLTDRKPELGVRGLLSQGMLMGSEH